MYHSNLSADVNRILTPSSTLCQGNTKPAHESNPGFLPVCLHSVKALHSNCLPSCETHTVFPYIYVRKSLCNNILSIYVNMRPPAKEILYHYVRHPMHAYQPEQGAIPLFFRGGIKSRKKFIGDWN